MSDKKTHNHLSTMVRYAFTMMLGTLASRILGLVREMITAAFFGATRQLDAFYIAYTLANLSRQLWAEGALSASFVPVFSQTLVKEGQEKARSLARQALTILLFLTTAAVIVGIVASGLLVKIMAPGFENADAVLAVRLTRWLFPFLILVSVGALAMGVLNSLDSYFIPSVAPAFSNLVYIVFLVLTFHSLGMWSLVAAVLLGGIASMGLQVFWSGKKGMPFIPQKPDLHDPDLRRMLSLFLPYAAGLSLNQINPVVSRMLASFLEKGAISVLTYADRVLQLPLGLFVIAISQAVLPMLSRSAMEDEAGFRDFIRDAMRFNLFMVLPVALFLLLFSSETVHLLFVRGAFGTWAWHATSLALAMYGLGLPGMACNTVLMRALYARSLPRDAVRVTVFTVVANLVFSAALMYAFSYVGLALATSIAFTGAALFASWRLSRNLGLPLRILERKWVGQIGLACLVFVGVIEGYRLFCPYPVGARILERGLWFVVLAGLSVVSYGGTTRLLRCREWEWLKGAAFTRRGEQEG